MEELQQLQKLQLQIKLALNVETAIIKDHLLSIKKHQEKLEKLNERLSETDIKVKAILASKEKDENEKQS